MPKHDLQRVKKLGTVCHLNKPLNIDEISHQPPATVASLNLQNSELGDGFVIKYHNKFAFLITLAAGLWINEIQFRLKFAVYPAFNRIKTLGFATTIHHADTVLAFHLYIGVRQ